MLDRPFLVQIPTLQVHCSERLRVRNGCVVTHAREAALAETHPTRPRRASMFKRVVVLEILVALSRRLLELGEVWEAVVEGSLLGGSGLLGLPGCSRCARSKILGFRGGSWGLRARSQGGRLTLSLGVASSCFFVSSPGPSGGRLLVHLLLWRILATSILGTGSIWC